MFCKISFTLNIWLELDMVQTRSAYVASVTHRVTCAADALGLSGAKIEGVRQKVRGWSYDRSGVE